MNQQEIIEGNKLIAEFMGAKMVVENYHGINIIEFPDKSTKDLRGLRYHSSWDWLMPVVEKIHTMEEYTEEYTSEQIIYAPILQAIPLYGIRRVWNEVVEFIKWYNEQKNNKEKE